MKQTKKNANKKAMEVNITFTGLAALQLHKLTEQFEDDIKKVFKTATPKNLIRLGVMYMQTLSEGLKEELDNNTIKHYNKDVK